MLNVSGAKRNRGRTRIGGRLALASIATAAVVTGFGGGQAAAQPVAPDNYNVAQAATAEAGAVLLSGGWSYEACHAKGQSGLGRIYSWYDCRAVGGSYELWVVYDCVICRTIPDGLKEGE